MSFEMNFDEKKMTCNWDKERICERNLYCGGCEYQPNPEDKKNGKNPPVKLPIVFDGYGNIPECPSCGEMPYSTEQCIFCGQKFIQDEEVEEYNKPNFVTEKCPLCGGEMVGTRSKYNGHFHGSCKNCGVSVIE